MTSSPARLIAARADIEERPKITTAFQIAQANIRHDQSRTDIHPPALSPQPTATREGQREIVAATLASGIIAAQGEKVTPEEAAAVLTDVLEQLPGHSEAPSKF